MAGEFSELEKAMNLKSQNHNGSSAVETKPEIQINKSKHTLGCTMVKQTNRQMLQSKTQKQKEISSRDIQSG